MLRPLRFSPLVVSLLCGVACTPMAPDPFDRGADDGHGGDDDDAHGDLGEDDRIAWFDLIRTAPFGAGQAGISTSVSFFAPTELDRPTAEGLDQCLMGSSPTDPWAIPVSDTGYGVPVVNLDGEDWEIERIGTPYFTRSLPERTWTPGAEIGLFAPGGSVSDAQTWLNILVLPETLAGSEAALTTEGISLTWTAGNASDQLRLVLKSVGTQQVNYMVCLPADDGSFRIEAEDLVDFPESDVVLTLERERPRDSWEVNGGARGQTLGSSRLKAEFSIPPDYFEDAGDDDDDTN